MPEGSITPELRQFINRCVSSVEQLEILRLLSSQPGRAFTVADVFREVRSSEKSIEASLEGFCRSDLLTAEPGGQYRFNPKTPELGQAVAELMRTYRERRVAVIELIYSKPGDTIQDFADAFKLRKEKPNG